MSTQAHTHFTYLVLFEESLRYHQYSCLCFPFFMKNCISASILQFKEYTIKCACFTVFFQALPQSLSSIFLLLCFLPKPFNDVIEFCN